MYNHYFKLIREYSGFKILTGESDIYTSNFNFKMSDTIFIVVIKWNTHNYFLGKIDNPGQVSGIFYQNYLEILEKNQPNVC